MKTLRCLLIAGGLALLPGIAGADSDVTSITRIDTSDPVGIVGPTAAELNDNAIRMCFGFRNLTAQNIKAVKFTIAFLDASNTPEFSFSVARNAKGYFPPGRLYNAPNTAASTYVDNNDGSQSCWVLASASSSGTAIKTISVRIASLTYFDGSVWNQGDTFTRAYAYDGTPVAGGAVAAAATAAPAFVPEPFNTTWTTNWDSAPVTVTLASIESLTDHTMRQCVTYRNVSNQPATSISFSFAFRDADGNAIPNVGFGMSDSGTFTPPILIENHCHAYALPTADTVRRMNREDIEVTRVTFQDGTEWARGNAYQKSFTPQGTAYSGPQPTASSVAGSTSAPQAAFPASSGGNSTTTSTDNTVVGGTIGPGGPLFGSIAWLPGSFDAFGSSVNKGTQLDADVDAINQCNAKAPNHAGCQKQGNGMSGAATRCGALGFDGFHFLFALGPDPDTATLKVLTDIQKQGGSADQTKFVVKACNSH